MEALMHDLAAGAALARSFALAHWQALLIAAAVLLSLLNKLLPGHPSLKSGARWVLDVLLAFAPMPGAKSWLLSSLAQKIGPNAAGAFVDWLSKWLNLPLSPSVATASPPLESVPSDNKPRGSVSFALLFSSAGAILVGVLFAHGLAEAALLSFAVFVGLLAIYVKARSAIVLLLVLGIGSGGCAFFKSPGVRACGTAFAKEQAEAIAILSGHGATGNWKMDLAVFEVQAGIELVHCILNQLAAQVTEGPADAGPPPPPVVQERAAAHLAEHAQAQ